VRAAPAAPAEYAERAPAQGLAPAQTPASTQTPGATPSTGPSPSPSATASPTPTHSPTGHPTGGQPTGGQPTGGQQGGQGGRTGAGCGTGAGGAGGAGGTAGATGRGGGSDSLLSAEQQLNNARLALQLAQDKLAGTTITAPVAGRVLSVAGIVGAQESPGGSGFVVLGGVNENDVRAMFSEADVAHLAIGQSATITLPNRHGQTLTGKVSQIDPAGVVSGRLVRYGVVVAFDQAPADVLLGETANVAVATESVSDVLFVSSAAVTGEGNGTGTVTVRTGGHDVRRTVQIGLRGDQYTEIRSGLAQGDQVLLSGH
jgi:hypothetical protein